MQQPPQNPYNPYQQPGNFAPPPSMPPQKPQGRFLSWYKRQSRAMQVLMGLGVVALALFVSCAACTGIVQGVTSSTSPTPTAQSQSTQVSQATTAPTTAPTQAPTKAPVSHWPPKTKDDLQALAAAGDASAIHAFHSESVGLTGVCPQPKVLVTVDQSVTGKQLAEDLLAYFFNNQLDNPCGSVVFAFHSQPEANGDNGYTAGRILLDTANADGSANNNPNATGLKYTLTINTGDVISGKEYTVVYNQ